MATIDLYAEHRVLTSDSCKDQCQGCTYLVGGGECFPSNTSVWNLLSFNIHKHYFCVDCEVVGVAS